MLQVKNISFAYKKTLVVQNISFEVKPGEHLSIIGESGSGKSTLLKLIYGEYDLNIGEIFWNKKQILGPKFNLITGPQYMKYVTQEFDLMPFTTVETNIGEFLSNLHLNKKKKRVEELVKVVGLEEVANTKVKYLSGGQKQRVALARALAKEPQIILLDEPFSHIDNFKKQSLRRNLFNYLKEKNITCIVATHDKNDVLGYADKMLVLNTSKIVAIDKPEKLYKNPKTPLVASFFGEFNSIDKQIIYAHEIKVIEKSKLKAIVVKSYFQGNYYLIEAILNDKKVLFHHDCYLKKEENVFLKITKYQ